MHRMRQAVQFTHEDLTADRLAWAKDFAVGWLAGLIFFGTMLG